MIDTNVFLYKFGSNFERFLGVFIEDFEEDWIKVLGDVIELILELDGFIDTCEMVVVDFFGELDSFIYVDKMFLVIFKV